MKSNNIKNLVYTGVLAALLCVCAPFSIPVGQIPFSFAVLIVLVCGVLLKPVYAFCSALIYILLGMTGLPVFANFASGAGVLAGPTGGYIVSYPLMALCVALFLKLSKKKGLPSLLLGMTTALLISYGLGTLWFSVVTQTPFVSGLAVCVLPFLPFDIIKILLAAAMGRTRDYFISPR